MRTSESKPCSHPSFIFSFLDKSASAEAGRTHPMSASSTKSGYDQGSFSFKLKNNERARR
jgi:hypothetical protein